MKTKSFLFILFIFLFACKSFETKEYIKGKKHLENLNYSAGIESFLKSWEQSPNPKTARGLALSYYKVRNFEQAEEWFAKLKRENQLDSTDLRPFAESLIANSKYSEAREILKILDPAQSSDMLKNLWSNSEYGGILTNDLSRSRVAPVEGINTKFSEFGPFIYQDEKLLWVSDRLEKEVDWKFNDNGLKNDIYGWTGNDYLSLYQVNLTQDLKSIFGSAEEIKGFESKYHIGPIYKSDQWIFITLTKAHKYRKTESGKFNNYTIFPEVYYIDNNLDSISLEDFMTLPFNSPLNYSVSDPFFDQKSQRLYFSSDMPGGQGGTDIYFSQWIDEKGWQPPINVGPTINTSFNERSPFFSEDGTFYFSSDGHIGLGGLDIFKSSKVGEDFILPVNLGTPINSNRDDFGFVLGRDFKQGFLASDRVGGKGLDDIYFVDLESRQSMILEGKVLDAIDSSLLADAVVSVFSENGGIINSFVTGQDGAYKVKLGSNQFVSINSRKTGYLKTELKGIEIPENTIMGDSLVFQDIYMNRIEIGKAYEIENIYYDFDKWNIREDAKPNLDFLLGILKENPTIKVEIRSHTDSRGTVNYNMRLSKRRAESVVDYLISNGISSSRLSSIGMGEFQIRNECIDNVECTEEKHQENRRTEFKIISY
ncbi:OmpA family protein [Algoriphagus algorifonticola]|uniref:OmpA family protein n=1 Tax=Algoriphagus algorifonticola TaxID=2593007 RepID=UPI0016436189|nr:OmpA family protein [Algoriphagus algorifonticola]